MEKTKTKQFWSPVKLGLGISIFAVVVTAAVTWVLYEHTVNLLTDNLRHRLLAIVTTQAANIDPALVESLQVEEDWKKSEWTRLVTRLKKAKDRNDDIVFMYIYRKNKNDGTKLEFVADAESINPYANSDTDPKNDVDSNKDGIVEPDGPDYLQWPGQEYPEPPEEAFLAFNGPTTSAELYEDAFGQVLTGYEPIYNEKGEIIAILAVDIRATDFFTITRQTLYPFLLFVGFLVAIMLILATALIRIWNSRVHFLQDLDRQKDELISIVSHQLATPVSSVKWYLEMMRDGDVGSLSDEQIKHVGTLQSVVNDLADLVSMILDVSRIQLGKMKVDRSSVDLKEFFNEIMTVIIPKAEQKEVKLQTNIPNDLPTSMLDKRLLRITLENLLSNAVKYTPTGGEVFLSVRIENGTLKYEVRDTGFGIPNAEQGKIFEKLFRASNAQKIEGNGFGLFAAKGAVEAQNGSIKFVSKEGKGTTFNVEIPL